VNPLLRFRVLCYLGMAALASLAFTASASAASAPSIEAESASNITATDATLEAQINPNGLETTYRFRVEFGCFSSRLGCQWISEEKLPTAKLPPSTQEQSVRLDLNEAGVTLHPGWEYRYSVEATNSSGTATGPSQNFKTPSDAPSIEGESLSNLTPTDATLEAQINTEGLETTYQFKMWASPCSHRGSGCESIMNVPLPSGSLLGSFVDQSVSLDLSSAGVTLTPGGEYGYSVTATNAAGSVEGPWHQFEPPLDSAPSIETESASNITSTGATLEAQINPNGLETTYQFILEGRLAGPRGGGMTCGIPCETGEFRIPAPPGEIAASSEAHSVSVDLSEAGLTLRAGERYRFRVDATSSAGSAEGPVQAFATPSPEPGPTPLDPPSAGSSPGPSPLANLPPAASSARLGGRHLPPRKKRRHNRTRRHKRAVHHKGAGKK
jgi:hypothetical protein